MGPAVAAMTAPPATMGTVETYEPEEYDPFPNEMDPCGPRPCSSCSSFCFSSWPHSCTFSSALTASTPAAIPPTTPSPTLAVVDMPFFSGLPCPAGGGGALPAYPVPYPAGGGAPYGAGGGAPAYGGCPYGAPGGPWPGGGC